VQGGEGALGWDPVDDRAEVADRSSNHEGRFDGRAFSGFLVLPPA
jgi:hypothetical protein